MKKLFLIRHAKSSWKDPGTTDIKRPLNQRGEKDALFMAKILKKGNIKPDYILTSNAVRAKTTAEIFAGVLNYPKDEIFTDSELYLAEISDFLKQANLLDEKINCAFIFSHNPGISEFVYYLTGETLIDMPACGIYGIEFDIHSWRQVKQGIGKSILFEYPKKYLDD